MRSTSGTGRPNESSKSRMDGVVEEEAAVDAEVGVGIVEDEDGTEGVEEPSTGNEGLTDTPWS